AKKQKCEMYHNSYTLYPFDQMFDFKFTRKHIKIINTPDYNDMTLLKLLNISGENNDIYFSYTMKNENRLYDTEEEPKKKLKGITFQSLPELRKRPEKLIHFGSLFGTYR